VVIGKTSPKVFHRKTRAIAQKALTDNYEEGTIRSKVTKTVINGVWEWVGPLSAGWSVACCYSCFQGQCSRLIPVQPCSIRTDLLG
jgi:hypothetical protein